MESSHGISLLSHLGTELYGRRLCASCQDPGPQKHCIFGLNTILICQFLTRVWAWNLSDFLKCQMLRTSDEVQYIILNLFDIVCVQARAAFQSSSFIQHNSLQKWNWKTLSAIFTAESVSKHNVSTQWHYCLQIYDTRHFKYL